MGILLKAFDCANSDEVPELSPVILDKIYLHFAANSFRRRETLTSCVETKREKSCHLFARQRIIGKDMYKLMLYYLRFTNGPRVQR